MKTKTGFSKDFATLKQIRKASPGPKENLVHFTLDSLVLSYPHMIQVWSLKWLSAKLTLFNFRKTTVNLASFIVIWSKWNQEEKEHTTWRLEGAFVFQEEQSFFGLFSLCQFYENLTFFDNFTLKMTFLAPEEAFFEEIPPSVPHWSHVLNWYFFIAWYKATRVQSENLANPAFDVGAPE